MICRCGHHEADHTIKGGCAVERNWWWRQYWGEQECGCQGFIPRYTGPYGMPPDAVLDHDSMGDEP